MAWTSHMRGSRRVELGPTISLMESQETMEEEAWPACQGRVIKRVSLDAYSLVRYLQLDRRLTCFPSRSLCPPWSFQCCNDIYVYLK